MSKARVAVLKVVSKELCVTATAAMYGYSRQHLIVSWPATAKAAWSRSNLRCRRPRNNARATSDEARDLVIQFRLKLTRSGLDA